MVFAKRLRDGVRRGEITCSVRIWTRPHVKVGNRYRMEEGEIEVDSIKPIGLPDITGELARESGFLGIVDLLKVAKRSEEHTSELQSLRHLVCRLLLEKKKKTVMSNQYLDIYSLTLLPYVHQVHA